MTLWGCRGLAPCPRGFFLARYEHLPIFKKAYDLNLYFEKTVCHFSRYHKYTLGTEVREKARKAVKFIAVQILR